jgi:hypothetical protein
VQEFLVFVHTYKSTIVPNKLFLIGRLLSSRRPSLILQREQCREDEAENGTEEEEGQRIRQALKRDYERNQESDVDETPTPSNDAQRSQRG